MYFLYRTEIRNKYDADDHVCCEGSKCSGKPGYGIYGKGNLFRLTAGGKSEIQE